MDTSNQSHTNILMCEEIKQYRNHKELYLETQTELKKIEKIIRFAIAKARGEKYVDSLEYIMNLINGNEKRILEIQKAKIGRAHV